MVVLISAALRLLDRVLEGILCQLFAYGGRNVDFGLVREEQGVDENVGELFANLRRIGRLSVLPEKSLEQFASFNR